MLCISFKINDDHIFEGEEFYEHIRIKPRIASEMLAFLFLLFCYWWPSLLIYTNQLFKCS